ncbi:MAG: enoyl-CoA hydratase/isomerase family protein [Chloroflexi bacterium]|nr:enoyl-CoA hydratase/isomerase family protein [Chloroflexota bacterium]
MTERLYVTLTKDPEKRMAAVTLNRPEESNALHREMWKQLAQAMNDVHNDDTLKAVVIKGAGDCFSVGEDMELQGREGYGWEDPVPGKERPRRPSQRRRLIHNRWMTHHVLGSIAYCNKPTIAQVHGACYGDAFSIALLCDLIVCSDDVLLGHPAARVFGPNTVYGAMAYYLRLGTALAKDLMFTGRVLDSAEAFSRGVANKVVPREQLEEQVGRYIQGISQMPADGIATGKAVEAIYQDIHGLAEGLNVAFEGMTLLSNMRWEPDEHNFYKERLKVGAKEAMRLANERFRGLYENDALFKPQGK